MLGIFARTFRRSDLAATLDAVRAAGLTAMQFNMARGRRPVAARRDPGPLAARVREETARRGLVTAAVSGTYGTPEAWRDMLASVAGAVATAEAHGVTLAFEPEPCNVVDSAAAGRRLLDEIRSPHLRVVRDAANLVAGAGLDRQAATLREAFHLLGDDVVLAHAKDVRRDGAIVAAGRGDLARRLPTGAPIGVASSPPPVVPCPAACPVQVIRLPRLDTR